MSSIAAAYRLWTEVGRFLRGKELLGPLSEQKPWVGQIYRLNGNDIDHLLRRILDSPGVIVQGDEDQTAAEWPWDSWVSLHIQASGPDGDPGPEASGFLGTVQIDPTNAIYRSWLGDYFWETMSGQVQFAMGPQVAPAEGSSDEYAQGLWLQGLPALSIKTGNTALDSVFLFDPQGRFGFPSTQAQAMQRAYQFYNAIGIPADFWPGRWDVSVKTAPPLSIDEPDTFYVVVTRPTRVELDGEERFTRDIGSRVATMRAVVEKTLDDHNFAYAPWARIPERVLRMSPVPDPSGEEGKHNAHAGQWISTRYNLVPKENLPNPLPVRFTSSVDLGWDNYEYSHIYLSFWTNLLLALRDISSGRIDREEEYGLTAALAWDPGDQTPFDEWSMQHGPRPDFELWVLQNELWKSDADKSIRLFQMAASTTPEDVLYEDARPFYTPFDGAPPDEPFDAYSGIPQVVVRIERPRPTPRPKVRVPRTLIQAMFKIYGAKT